MTGGTAIDVPIGARNKTRRRAGDERHDPGDFIGCGEPAHGVTLHNSQVTLGLLPLDFVPQPPIGKCVTGRNSIDPGMVGNSLADMLFM